MASRSAQAKAVSQSRNVIFERVWQVVDGSIVAAWRPGYALFWHEVAALLRPTSPSLVSIA